MRVSQAVGERLMLARRRAGLNQVEAGQAIGVHGTAVGKWELGIAEPSIQTLFRLADLYKVDITFFLEGAEGCLA